MCVTLTNRREWLVKLEKNTRYDWLSLAAGLLAFLAAFLSCWITISGPSKILFRLPSHFVTKKCDICYIDMSITKMCQPSNYVPFPHCNRTIHELPIINLAGICSYVTMWRRGCKCTVHCVFVTISVNAFRVIGFMSSRVRWSDRIILELMLRSLEWNRWWITVSSWGGMLLGGQQQSAIAWCSCSDSWVGVSGTCDNIGDKHSRHNEAVASILGWYGFTVGTYQRMMLLMACQIYWGC